MLKNQADKINLRIKQEIKDSKSRLSICLDIWTTKSFKNAYIGMTAHFIDKDIKLRKRFLGLAELKCRHTSVNIYKHIMKFLTLYNLTDDDVFLYISDNASNLLLALSVKIFLNFNLKIF